MVRVRRGNAAKCRRQQSAARRPLLITAEEVRWYQQAIAVDDVTKGIFRTRGGVAQSGLEQAASNGQAESSSLSPATTYVICSGHGAFLCTVGYGHLCGDL